MLSNLDAGLSLTVEGIHHNYETQETELDVAVHIASDVSVHHYSYYYYYYYCSNAIDIPNCSHFIYF